MISYTIKKFFPRFIFSSPRQRQRDLLPSLGLTSVCKLFTFSYSPLKPLSQMNWNLVGSIYVRSSIKIVHFVPIRWQTWPPQAILDFDWSISKKSSPLKLHGQMNWNLVESIYGRSSYKDCSFCPGPLTNMADTGMFVSDWSISKKYSPLKPLGQMNRNLVGNIYGRSSIKIAHFGLIR